MTHKPKEDEPQEKEEYAPLFGVPISEFAAERKKIIRGNRENYKHALIDKATFQSLRTEKRKFIVNNLILKETITIINGERGCGKSFFVMALLNEIIYGGRVGPWKVMTPVNCLLIDGEMTVSRLQERLDQLDVGRITHKGAKRLYIYPEAMSHILQLEPANMLDEMWQSQVERAMQAHDIKLVCFDNLSSLAPMIDENMKSDFDPINMWLSHLRAMGITVIVTHHTGKGGEQRGTSAHEDRVDTALCLEKKSNTTDKGCTFTLTPTKDRSFIMQGGTYTLELIDTEDGGVRFEVVALTREQAKMILMQNPKLTVEEAAKFNIAERTFERAKSDLGLTKGYHGKK